VQPATAEEAAAIVRIAVEEKCSVIPCGARSSLAIGLMPARYDVALDSDSRGRIVHYDPGRFDDQRECGHAFGDTFQSAGRQETIPAA